VDLTRGCSALTGVGRTGLEPVTSVSAGVQEVSHPASPARSESIQQVGCRLDIANRGPMATFVATSRRSDRRMGRLPRHRRWETAPRSSVRASTSTTRRSPPCALGSVWVVPPRALQRDGPAGGDGPGATPGQDPLKAGEIKQNVENAIAAIPSDHLRSTLQTTGCRRPRRHRLPAGRRGLVRPGHGAGLGLVQGLGSAAAVRHRGRSWLLVNADPTWIADGL
jgi:hypothetical protein